MTAYGVRSVIRLNVHINIWLLSDEVEVFVKAIEEEGEEFVCVVLLKPRELGGMFANH